MENERYSIDDYSIIDQQTSKRFYIREILDMCCAEYKFSELTNAQKLNIIEIMGLDRLTQVLDDCFKYAGKTYDAKAEAEFTYGLLKREIKSMSHPNLNSLNTSHGKVGNELFEIVNDWLGWGDPKTGLWCIGMEEGVTFDKGISARRGKRFDPVDGERILNWPVATTTAKLASKLLDQPSHPVYRDTVMWRKGSRVFNGNLMPLGKPKRIDWPEQYEQLFGLSFDDYAKHLNVVTSERYENFRNFRKDMRPQAIVCFGKGMWPEFKDVFVQNNSSGFYHKEWNIEVYDSDRVILTGHFSYGRWMPNKTIDFVAKQLKEWGVRLKT